VDDVRSFIERLSAIQRVWEELDRLERVGQTDAVAAAAEVSALQILVLRNPPTLVRAADLLASWNYSAEARNLLLGGLAWEGAAAPLQLSYARRLREVRAFSEARAAYRTAMLRARPDAALLFEYAALEQEAGAPDAATAIARVAPEFRVWSDAALVAAGKTLRTAGRPDLALRAFLVVFRRGRREPSLLNDMLALRDVDEPFWAQPFVEDIAGSPTLAEAITTLAAHARLADAQDRVAMVSAARKREASPAYLDSASLHAMLRDTIAARRAFSLIRLGDGEGRFLLNRKPELYRPLTFEDAQATAAFMWSIWFGQDMAGETRLDEVGAALDTAISEADVLGLPLADRLATDGAHLGYLAVLEKHVASLSARPGRLIVDASCNLALDRLDSFLAGLLQGLDFLGVISPHPELAGRLQRHLGIGSTTAYDIPGEGRLCRAREASDRGQHFPAVFDRIMTELVVPRPGAVFLVAGGLLGKLYCARVRQLGGIALDIGAIADAWMGYNTRGRALDEAMTHVLPI